MIERIKGWPRWVWWGLFYMLAELLVFLIAGRVRTQSGPIHDASRYIAFAQGGYFLVFMYFLTLPEITAFYVSALLGAGIWFLVGTQISRLISRFRVALLIWLLLSILNMIIGNALWDMIYF